jgi:rhodanese-related sulfurtransferase
MPIVPEITVETLAEWRAENKPHFVVDVREIHEYQTSNLGGKHIPMAFCLSRVNELPTDIPVVFHCRSGQRAAAVVSAVMQKKGLTNVWNLQGGILAWKEVMKPEWEVA